jgi:hypothetical protein
MKYMLHKIAETTIGTLSSLLPAETPAKGA